LKLKLQSAAYVKSAKQQTNRLQDSRPKLGSKVDSKDLKFDVDFQVGDFKQQTEGLRFFVQNSAEVTNNFRTSNSFGESDTAILAVFDCTSEATAESFSVLEPIFEEVAGGVGAKVSMDFSATEKTLTIKVIVPPEIAALGLGVLETANLNLLDLEVSGDQKNKAFRATFKAALSRNIIELGHEMGAIPDEFVKMVDMYLSSRLRIHLRSPDQVPHPLVKQGFEMATADRSKLSKLSKLLVKEMEEEAKTFFPIAMQLSSIRKVDLAVGNALFTLVVNLPDFIQNFKFDLDASDQSSKESDNESS